MNEVQLYINGQRADLFPDENISITSSIQNSSDISKIFTDFSQSFTIPASNTNNKIFKHYYNADISLGYNFDARQKVDANIELNYAHYRKGKLRLDGVQLKQGKPSAYKVTFFGNTVTLPDLLGEDLLSDLVPLSAYDHEYSESQVLTGLQTSLVSGNIIYPLISPAKRFYYNSTETTNTGGNLFYNASYDQRGVNFTDLKPAIKLKPIIEAIETQYNLTFDSNFFDGTLEGFEDVFPNLFMWLHSKKGAMQTSEGVVTLSLIKNFAFESGTDLMTVGFGNSLSSDGSTFFLNADRFPSVIVDYQVDLRIVPVESGEYNIYVYGNDVLLSSANNVSGTYSIVEFIDTPTKVSYKIETSGGITNYDAELEIRRYETDPATGDGGLTDTGYYDSTNQTLISSVSVRDNIPNMRVIDFLTNLFKMFNLTAFVKQTGQIYVEPLDTFYADGKTIDISQYINNEATDINRAIPYKNIKFEFPESKTFFAEKRNQIFGGTQYGNLISQQTKYDGTDYSVNVAFEKMVYERISNQADSSLTDIGWGWSVDYNGDTAEEVENAKSVLGKPLIFFNVNTDSSSTPISFWGSNHNSLSTYNRPSNVNEAETQTLNFNAEIDEFNLETNSNSLYKVFYDTYMGQVFSPLARKYSYTAKLPNRLLLNYSINDTFIIQDRAYIINTIQTDAGSGRSKLELINKIFKTEIPTTTTTSTTTVPTTTTTTVPTTTTTTEATTTTTCQPNGTLLYSYCSGNDLRGVYADGTCGAYDLLIEENSPSCLTTTTSTTTTTTTTTTLPPVDCIRWAIDNDSSTTEVYGNYTDCDNIFQEIFVDVLDGIEVCSETEPNITSGTATVTNIGTC